MSAPSLPHTSRTRLVPLTSSRQIHMLSVGHGSTQVVFLHGVGGSPELYYEILERAAQELDLTLFCPWLPNHGQSSTMSSYAEVVSTLLEWQRAVGIPPGLWVGHSIGGFLAVGAAHVDHDSVRSVLTIGAPLGAPHTKRPITSTYLVPRLTYLAVEAALFGTAAQLHAGVQGHYGRLWQAQAHTMTSPVRAACTMAVMKSAPDLTRPMKGLVACHGLRLTHLFGAWDRVVPPPDVPLPGATVVVPKALHNFPLAGWGPSSTQVIRSCAELLGTTWFPDATPGRPRRFARQASG